MKNKYIITVIFAMIVLGGLMWWSRPIQKPVESATQPATDGGGTLVASEKLYDFGTISMANGKVNKIFTITNPTSQNIQIESIVTSCMCTVAYLETPTKELGPFGMPGHGGPVAKVNEVIRAGETRSVKVVYDPNAHGPAGVGPIDRSITITDLNGNTLQLAIKAVVTP